jgi:hypothetical protein
MRWMMALAVLLLAGCGGSPQQPPSARALAARMGCTVLGPGLGFAGYDVKQDAVLTGPHACLGDEVYTFATAKQQADWLHQVQVSNAGQNPPYSNLVNGNLWVVIPGPAAGVTTVIRKAGGKEVTF